MCSEMEKTSFVMTDVCRLDLHVAVQSACLEDGTIQVHLSKCAVKAVRQHLSARCLQKYDF